MDVINCDFLVIESVIIARHQIVWSFCGEVFISVKWGWICQTFFLLVLEVSSLQKLVSAEFPFDFGHDSFGRLLRVNGRLLGQLLEPVHFLLDPLLRQVGGRLLTFPGHMLYIWRRCCLTLLCFHLILLLLHLGLQDYRSNNLNCFLLIVVPLEHPIQAFLQMCFVLILSHLLSLICNYRLFFVFLVFEADVSVAEPFVIILWFRFAALTLVHILVNIIRCYRVEVFSNRHSQITIAVLFHLRCNSFLIWLEHSHIVVRFGSLFFLHRYFVIWPISVPYCRNMVRNDLLWLWRNIILLLSFILQFGFQLVDLSPQGFDLRFLFVVLVLILLILHDKLLSHYLKLFFQLIQSLI